MQLPTLNNMKDQYYILFVRSVKVRSWYPLNIISGSEAAKTLKNVKDNQLAQAVGGDRLAKYQMERAIGMQIYGNKDEVKKQSLNMHSNLRFASDLQYGYKEILNNTKFNDNPREFMMLDNITTLPPEEELRNLLDDAGEAVQSAGDSISKVGDNIKGFFSSGSSGTGS